jgi:membrane associated rhomboid family serine protease
MIGLYLFSKQVSDLTFTKTAGMNIIYIFRAFTTQFVHIQLFHLILNCFFLIDSSNQAIKYMSLKKILFCYGTAIIFVGVLTFFFTPQDYLCVGNSGAISALYGAFVCTALKKNKDDNKLSIVTNAIVFLVATLIVPGIAIVAHFAGFGFGVLLALCYMRKDSSQTGKS